MGKHTDIAKTCFVCKTSDGELKQVGSKFPLYHHHTCDHKLTCYVCGKPVEVHKRDSKGNITVNEDGYVRIMGGYVRHTECEVGSVVWYENPVFKSSEFRSLFDDKMQELKNKENEKMAKKADIKAKIRSNKNLTQGQKELKDLMGRVKYLCYMDTNPNASLGWSLKAGKYTVSRESAKAKLVLKHGTKIAKATTKDAVLADLQHEFDQSGE